MVFPDAKTVTSWYQAPLRACTDETDFIGMTSTSSGPPASIPVRDMRLVGLVRSMRSRYSVTIEFRPGVVADAPPHGSLGERSGLLQRRLVALLGLGGGLPGGLLGGGGRLGRGRLGLAHPVLVLGLGLQGPEHPAHLRAGGRCAPGARWRPRGAASEGGGPGAGGGGGGASGTAIQNSHPSGAAGHAGSGRQSLPGVKPSATCQPGGGLNRYAITHLRRSDQPLPAADVTRTPGASRGLGCPARGGSTRDAVASGDDIDRVSRPADARGRPEPAPPRAGLGHRGRGRG